MNRLKEITPMKTFLRTVLCVFALILLAAGPAHAQRILTTTTLAANVAAADNSITVTSTTGFTVGQLIFVDWELMRIQSLNGVAGTATVVNVTRGVDGTAARAHDNAERLIVSLINTDFHNTNPDFGADCTRGSGQAAISPWVNTTTGNIFVCSAAQTGVWSVTNVLPITWNSIPTSF